MLIALEKIGEEVSFLNLCDNSIGKLTDVVGLQNTIGFEELQNLKKRMSSRVETSAVQFLICLQKLKR